MKTNFLTRFFLISIVSFSLFSCTEDSVTDTKSQAAEVAPSTPQTQPDVTAEEIITKPRT